MKNQTHTKSGPGRMVANKKKGATRHAPSYYLQSIMKYDAEVTASLKAQREDCYVCGGTGFSDEDGGDCKWCHGTGKHIYAPRPARKMSARR